MPFYTQKIILMVTSYFKREREKRDRLIEREREKEDRMKVLRIRKITELQNQAQSHVSHDLLSTAMNNTASEFVDTASELADTASEFVNTISRV